MTKTVSTSKKPRKQHSPEFRSEALKLAERIGVTAAARELSLYESQLYIYSLLAQLWHWRDVVKKAILRKRSMPRSGRPDTAFRWITITLASPSVLPSHDLIRLAQAQIQ